MNKLLNKLFNSTRRILNEQTKSGKDVVIVQYNKPKVHYKVMVGVEQKARGVFEEYDEAVKKLNEIVDSE